MRKFRHLFFTAFAAVCCGGALSGCVKEAGENPDSATNNVSVLLNIGTRSVDDTNGTLADGEGDLHTLRVYAFANRTDECIGYFYSEDLESPESKFWMDIALKSTTIQKVDFYAVANEKAMGTPGSDIRLSENTTRQQLEEFRFTRLYTEGHGLPMFCKQPDMEIHVAEDAGTDNPSTVPGHEGHTPLASEITLELRRPVAKLGVFAAKSPGEASELKITSLTMLKQGTLMHNYLMPQNETTLQGISPMGSDIPLTPVTTEVGPLNIPQGITEEVARSNPANYTPVLAQAFYPFENPRGNGGNGNTPGDPRGNVLEIGYAFGSETPRTGRVYLPAIVRNNYYPVCVLISHSGAFRVEYLVAPWEEGDIWDELIFDYPTYTPLQISPNEKPGSETKAPTIYYNPLYDADDDAIFEAGSPEAEGSYSFFFQLSAPSEQSWTATLPDAAATDYSATVYDTEGRKVEAPVASTEFYRIVVRALNEDTDYVGKIIKLGIAYTPTWEGAGGSRLLLINGTSDKIQWPGHTDRQVPELVEIKQIANNE